MSLLEDLDLVAAVSLAGKAADAEGLTALRAAGLTGLRVGHGYVVQRLIDGPDTIGEIARQLGVSQQSVSRSIGELTVAGYVRAVEDPVDRRRRLQELTERGRQAVAVSRRARAELVARLEAEVGARDLGVASAVVVRLLQVLGVDDDIRRRAVRPGDQL